MLEHSAGLSEEDLQIRETARRFMRNEIWPAEQQVPHDAYALPDHLLHPLQQKAKQVGLWAVRAPAEYGGGGVSLLTAAVVAEESTQCRMGGYIPACGVFGANPPTPVQLGTKYQIEKFLIPSIRDGKKTFVAISEASGGSDPARAIRTRAVKKGDRYILNGAKMWISGARDAQWGLVFARTGDQGARGGITCFIIDGKPKGMTCKEIPVIRSWSPYEVIFEDVEVPEQHRLGEEGQGFALCEKWLVEGRVAYAARALGLAQQALSIAVNWARERQTFGSRLADKQAIQWMIADSELELRQARLLIYEAARLGDAGRNFKIESSMAKVVSTETAGRVVDRCIQILGGMGVSKEMPLERWYRELRIQRIGEGPSEVHRMVIAREILNSVRL